MPCDQIRTVTAELDTARQDVFKLGLEAKGFQVTQQGNLMNIYKNGRFIAQHNGEKLAMQVGWATSQAQAEDTVNELKRAYSEGIINFAIAELGFTQQQEAEQTELGMEYLAQRSY